MTTLTQPAGVSDSEALVGRVARLQGTDIDYPSNIPPQLAELLWGIDLHVPGATLEHSTVRVKAVANAAPEQLEAMLLVIAAAVVRQCRRYGAPLFLTQKVLDQLAGADAADVLPSLSNAPDLIQRKLAPASTDERPGMAALREYIQGCHEQAPHAVVNAVHALDHNDLQAWPWIKSVVDAAMQDVITW